MFIMHYDLHGQAPCIHKINLYNMYAKFYMLTNFGNFEFVGVNPPLWNVHFACMALNSKTISPRYFKVVGM